MKRLIVALLAVLYLCVSTGAAVHVHYCMGRMIGASLTLQEDHACSHCGMKKKAGKGCCRDEHKVLKSTGDRQMPAPVPIDFSQFAIAARPAVWVPRNSVPRRTNPTGSLAMTHAPPGLWRTCPLYKQVCNFRI